MSGLKRHLDFTITPQPSETTCGPACLHALYRYYGDELPLDQVIAEVDGLPGGGTLAAYLALHAQRRGYHVAIYTVDLQTFDPTWFAPDGPDIADCLHKQMMVKDDPRLHAVSHAYIEFLERGGALFMEEVTPQLIARRLRDDTPIITGLSATWLYNCSRERQADMQPDDIAGEPTGHFVVLRGIDPADGSVAVADPYLNMPLPGRREYHVDTHRLISSILLGVVTWDAKLLIITPGDNPAKAV
jgi:hypothetical protein